MSLLGRSGPNCKRKIVSGRLVLGCANPKKDYIQTKLCFGERQKSKNTMPEKDQDTRKFFVCGDRHLLKSGL